MTVTLAMVGPLTAHGDQPGTPTGHARHHRAGEPACEHCADAWRTYKRARREAAGCIRNRHDPIAVEAAVAGHRIRLSTVELGEAVRELNRRGYTDPEIATRLRVTAQTVLRHRRRLGIPAAVPPGHHHHVPRPRQETP